MQKSRLQLHSSQLLYICTSQSIRSVGRWQYIRNRCFKFGHFPATCFFILVFSIQFTAFFNLPMTGFELRTSGVRSDCSTHWTSTTSHIRTSIRHHGFESQAHHLRFQFIKLCNVEKTKINKKRPELAHFYKNIFLPF